MRGKKKKKEGRGGTGRDGKSAHLKATAHSTLSLSLSHSLSLKPKTNIPPRPPAYRLALPLRPASAFLSRPSKLLDVYVSWYSALSKSP